MFCRLHSVLKSRKNTQMPWSSQSMESGSRFPSRPAPQQWDCRSDTSNWSFKSIAVTSPEVTQNSMPLDNRPSEREMCCAPGSKLYMAYRSIFCKPNASPCLVLSSWLVVVPVALPYPQLQLPLKRIPHELKFCLYLSFYSSHMHSCTVSPFLAPRWS